MISNIAQAGVKSHRDCKGGNMRSWPLSVCIGLSLVVTPVFPAASSGEKINNPMVVVTEDTLAPGESEAILSNRPSVIVPMSNGSAQFAASGGRSQAQALRRGGVIFHGIGFTAIKNDGALPLHFARIEFLTAGKQETWGNTGLTPSYKILLDNRYARVYSIRIASQASEPQHTHHDRVVIVLAGAKLEHILPNGKKEPVNLTTDEIAWHPAATHQGHNLGQTNFWAIIVEPK